MRELKNGISALIEGVENVEIVTITRRGKPVARIVTANVPPGIARLVAEGRVRMGSGPPGIPSGEAARFGQERRGLRARGPALTPYLDTSALIKLLVAEAGSDAARAIASQGERPFTTRR